MGQGLGEFNCAISSAFSRLALKFCESGCPRIVRSIKKYLGAESYTILLMSEDF